MKSINNFVGDELAAKVKYLSMALTRANKIIEQLEQENKRLNQLLAELSDKQTEITDEWFSGCHL